MSQCLVQGTVSNHTRVKFESGHDRFDPLIQTDISSASLGNWKLCSVVQLDCAVFSWHQHYGDQILIFCAKLQWTFQSVTQVPVTNHGAQWFKLLLNHQFFHCLACSMWTAFTMPGQNILQDTLWCRRRWGRFWVRWEGKSYEWTVLQWIPAHTGIQGNEMADQLAKEGREKEQPPSHLSYREVKTLIHNKKKAIFHCKTEGYSPNQDALHQLARHQQTVIFRLRTGHCRLNSRLKRTGVKTSAQCPCGEADKTPEHYLQSCSLHQQAKQQIWPTCMSLKTKLWGSAEDLFLTSRYAALTGERI